MTAGDVREQRAMRGGRGRRKDHFPLPLGGCKSAGEKTDGGGFNIALATSDLAGEPQVRLGTKAQRRIEQLWRVEERVAMQTAQAGELGLFQPWNGTKDARLLAMPELRLEADHIEQRAESIVLAQLNDRISLRTREVRVCHSERLHWTVAQRFATALRHHFDRQASIEIGRRGFPVAELDLLPRQQGFDERVVLLACERAIDVVRARSTGAGFVVARLPPPNRHVYGVAVNDRRNCVEEGECVLSGEPRDCLGKIG